MKEMIKTPDRWQVLGIDVDGTLTDGLDCFTEEECRVVKPDLEMIECVNKAYRGNYIIITSARRIDLIPETLRWLDRYNVLYNGYFPKKPAIDMLVDDRAVSPEQFKEMVKKGEICLDKRGIVKPPEDDGHEPNMG